MYYQKLKSYTEPGIHILIWSGMIIFALMFFRTIGPFTKIDNTLFWPLLLGTSFNAFLFYFTAHFLIPRYARRKNPTRFLLLLTFLFLFVTFLETVLDFFYLVWIYSDSPEPFYSMLMINGVVHLIFVSLALGYGFSRIWIVNEKKKQELIREKLTAELNFLKTQLNPHFLFNVLNMAYSSANQSRDERTADIIEKLSVLMRYMIYESNAEKVSAQKEIAFLQYYIELQKMRFSKDLPVKLHFEITGDYTHVSIAPLILLPFVENVFKHGVKLDKPSEIFISIHFYENEMELTTRNTIFTPAQNRLTAPGGVGLENTRKRLNLIYPEKHTLEINDEGNLFVVKLKLKLR